MIQNQDLHQKVENIIHANTLLNNQIKTLTDITLTLHQSNTLMQIRVDMLQKDVENAEKLLKKNY